MVAEDHKPHLQEIWTDYLNDLQEWMEVHDRAPRRRTTDAEEYRLANWVNRQAVSYRNGKLSEELVAKLYAVIDRPGAVPEDRIRRSMEEVREFVAEHERIPGQMLIPGRDRIEVRLGVFIARFINRAKQGWSLPVSLDRDELLELGQMRTRGSAEKTADELEEFIRVHRHWPRNKGSEINLYQRASLAISRGRSGNHPGAQENYDRVIALRQRLRTAESERSFSDSLVVSERFVQEWGHLPGFSTVENRWISLVSRRIIAVPAEYTDRWEELRNAPRANELSFEARATETEQWIAENGKIPTRITNKKLGNWFRNQTYQMRQGNLSDKRSARIEKILSSVAIKGEETNNAE